MTDSADRVEEAQLTIYSRLVECQKIAAGTLDKLLAAGMLREWHEYLPMYWRLIQTRLEFERKLAKAVADNKAKDPSWNLQRYLHLDCAVSHP